MEKGTIHIACNIDTSYVKYCIVMLTSLFENNREAKFHIHVIAGELSEEARRQLCNWVEQHYSQTLTIYEAGEDLLKGCMIYGNSHISLATYYRIFLETILPQDLQKVIYLDCDLVVNGSIKNFWDADISDYAVGCVEDMWSGKSDNYTRLHYDASFSYFNAGVLLVNLDYWRKIEFQQKAVMYISQHVNELVFNDQDVLNALLHDCKLFLPFRYNVQDGFLRRKRRIRPEVWAVLDKELLHPVIMHYTGGKKPWQYKSQHPYKNLYFHYLDLTPWKGERPVVPFSYKLKRTFDQLCCFMRLARPKYRKCIELCPKNS
ncbi:glycosyltransferase family 8 [Bacteroides sp. CAG:875]|jgi:lipopolysaccharide biosynthesis glycosyltransferase|nr:glycosyltransferase family 8 [Bacteroides sp. CAG:875]